MKKGNITWNKKFNVGKTDKYLFGSFLEHLGGCIYGGIYEPDHVSADQNGFRNDVKNLVRELGVTAVRYPGGNFVSGYHWKDGIGTKENRHVRWNLAWQVMESNQVGIAEMAGWLKECGAEMIAAVNLGTGTAEEAAELWEYCNGSVETCWGGERKKDGHEKPFGIKHWCLGNEMDGDWQIMARSAEDYARLAKETAKLIKWRDAEAACIFCGSSTNEKGHGTYGDWDRSVLETAGKYVDYLSLHRYYNYRPQKQLFYPSVENKTDIPYIFRDLNQFIGMAEGLCRFMKEKRHSAKEIYLAFDEWGIISGENAVPGGISQEYAAAQYTLMDAVICGGILCTFLNHADRVKIACQALLVNEGGMIAVQPGGKAIRQTTYYPFYDMVHFGQGVVLQQRAELPFVETDHHGEQEAVVAAAVYREAEKEITVFLANCDPKEDIEMELILQSFGGLAGIEWREMSAELADAGNTFQEEYRVIPKRKKIEDTAGGPVRVILKKHSWNVLRWKVSGDILL